MNMFVCECTCMCVCACARARERASRQCASHRYKNVRTNPIELSTARFLAYSPCVCEAKDLSIRTKVVAKFRKTRERNSKCVGRIFLLFV